MAGILTRSQMFAQRAFAAVERRNPDDKYRSFALSFPALLHNCGLAQAVAFAVAKKSHHLSVLEDVAATIGCNQAELIKNSREHQLGDYLRLSREALEAASWIKRYTEALHV